MLGVEESGIESCEALLLARHFMYRRIYNYPSIKAFAFHLGRFMLQEYGKRDSYHDLTDNEVLAQLRVASCDTAHKAHSDAEAFFVRKRRFKAYPLTDKHSEEELSKLKEKLNVSITTWDETLSTKDAIKLSIEAGIKQKKRKKMEDAYSATIMLQEYIDSI